MSQISNIAPAGSEPVSRGGADRRSPTAQAPEVRAGAAQTERVSISQDARQVGALKDYVRQLLEQQGIELDGAYWDELTVEGAQAAIAEGGEWSAEAVADRIIGFVSEISGADPEMKERLQEAVRQGFEEARQLFGGWLPAVSERTFELVMERFDEAFKPPEEAEQSAP